MTATYTTTYTYTHTVTYLAGKLLLSLKNIILKSGLNPDKLVGGWESHERAITTWLKSGHLQEVTIEVYRPGGSSLIGRWDLSVEYGAEADGFWFDPDDIYYQIRKQNAWPSDCNYSIIITNKPGRPDVADWGPVVFSSTDGMVRQSIGTMINANGLKASASYWRTS
jgi:hypothetical protein